MSFRKEFEAKKRTTVFIEFGEEKTKENQYTIVDRTQFIMEKGEKFVIYIQ
jgi:hypothetical protein